MGWRLYTLPHNIYSPTWGRPRVWPSVGGYIHYHTQHLQSHLRNATSLSIGWRLYTLTQHLQFHLTLTHTTSTTPPEEGHEFDHGLEVAGLRLVAVDAERDPLHGHLDPRPLRHVRVPKYPASKSDKHNNWEIHQQTINLNMTKFKHKHCHVLYCEQRLCGDIWAVIFCWDKPILGIVAINGSINRSMRSTPRSLGWEFQLNWVWPLDKYCIQMYDNKCDLLYITVKR